MPSDKQIRILISGRVQGVFFRAFVKEQAERLGIDGSVRNTEDGVEVVAQGEQWKLDELVKYCRKGTNQARVDDVEIEEIESEKIKGFKII